MPDNSSNNKRIAKNTVFLYIRMAFVMLVTLYTVRVVLNTLGVVDYGVYNVVCGFVAMFGVLNTTLSSGINRFYNYELGKKEEGSVQTVYNSAIRIQGLLAIIVFVAVECVGIWYVNNKMVIPNERLHVANWIFQFSVVSIICLIIQIPYSGAIAAFEKMDYLAFVGIIEAFLKLGMVYIVKIVNFDKLLLYGFLMMLISITAFLLYFVYVKTHFKFLKFQRRYDKSMIKPLLTFSGWMLLDPLAYTIKGQGTNMALNYYRGPVMNAAYGLSNQVAQALESFSANISTAFKPQIIQSYSAGDYMRTKRLFFSMSKAMFILKLLLCVPIVLETPYLLHIWLGEDFPEIAIRFSQLLVVSGVINSFAHPITVLVSSKGNIKNYMIITSIIVSFVFPISIVFLAFGFASECVYWVMIFSAIVNLIAAIIILSYELPFIRIWEYCKVVILPCAFHTVLLLIPLTIIYCCMAMSFWRLVVIVICSCVLSLLFSYLIVLDKYEKEMLKMALKKISLRLGFKH